jgi:hypothetical protein
MPTPTPKPLARRSPFLPTSGTEKLSSTRRGSNLVRSSARAPCHWHTARMTFSSVSTRIYDIDPIKAREGAYLYIRPRPTLTLGPRQSLSMLPANPIATMSSRPKASLTRIIPHHLAEVQKRVQLQRPLFPLWYRSVDRQARRPSEIATQRIVCRQSLDHGADSLPSRRPRPPTFQPRTEAGPPR